MFRPSNDEYVLPAVNKMSRNFSGLSGILPVIYIRLVLSENPAAVIRVGGPVPSREIFPK
jgi:hypothetical protein